MTALHVIDTAALREERIKEYERLLMASCQALNKFRSAQDAYELGLGSKADVERARRACNKAHRAAEAAQDAAYGAEEAARQRAKIEALVAEGEAIEAAYFESPGYQKARRDYENRKNYGARQTQHAGFTVIDGSRS